MASPTFRRKTDMTRSATTTWNDDCAFDSALAGATSGRVLDNGAASGIVAGTRIATAMGWRPVEAIAVGDMVMTFDSGLRPVVDVKRTQLWLGHGRCPDHRKPLAVPVGALGNKTPMLLLPEQNMMVESDMAEAIYGDPFAVIPASALEGYRGIDRITPHRPIDVIVLEFEEEEIVYANGSGMVHCGSVNSHRLEALFDDDAGPNYETLSLEMARSIVAGLIDEDLTAHAYAAE